VHDDQHPSGSLPPEDVNSWVDGVVDGFTAMRRLPARRAEFDHILQVLLAHLEQRGAPPEVVDGVQCRIERLWGTSADNPSADA
jgi:hypothetical protein